jgi:serine/threonine protein kinase
VAYKCLYIPVLPGITTVMGAVVGSGVDPMLVMEYCEYGSLYDLLRNETMYAGGEIILQIVRDIAQGLRYLHASKPPILHGDLKAKNILVDSRFRAKVCTTVVLQCKSLPVLVEIEYLTVNFSLTRLPGWRLWFEYQEEAWIVRYPILDGSRVFEGQDGIQLFM